jgi:hypothetical protein
MLLQAVSVYKVLENKLHICLPELTYYLLNINTDIPTEQVKSKIDLLALPSV